MALNAALLAAVGAGDEGGVEQALRDGASQDASRGRGWSAVMIAAYKGHVELVRLLADHRANNFQGTADGRLPDQSLPAYK